MSSPALLGVCLSALLCAPMGYGDFLYDHTAQRSEPFALPFAGNDGFANPVSAAWTLFQTGSACEDFGRVALQIAFPVPPTNGPGIHYLVVPILNGPAKLPGAPLTGWDLRAGLRLWLDRWYFPDPPSDVIFGAGGTIVPPQRPPDEGGLPPPHTTVVPEPPSLILVFAGLTLLAFRGFARRRTA